MRTALGPLAHVGTLQGTRTPTLHTHQEQRGAGRGTGVGGTAR